MALYLAPKQIANHKQCPKCPQQPDEQLIRKQMNSILQHKPQMITINMQTLTGRKIILSVAPQMTIAMVKYRVCDVDGIPFDQQLLVYPPTRLVNNYKKLSAYNIKHGAKLKLVLLLRGGGMRGLGYNPNTECIEYGSDQYNVGVFAIKSYHVSCRSDKIYGQNMVGVILYLYDNKDDWYLNGVHCKSGYIILKSFDKIKDIQSGQGQVHGKCYKSVFNRDIDNKVIGGGFACKNNQWKFNSYTFNVGTVYHDNNKAMHPMEQQVILAAIENWKNGVQNTLAKDIRRKYQGSCSMYIHGFW